jgi:hypothetical protein
VRTFSIIINLILIFRDGSAAYTYTLTRNGADVVETTIDHRKFNRKADAYNESSADIPELVAYRARECVACLRVADTLNAGVKLNSLIDRDFDWAQFQVGFAGNEANLSHSAN